MSLSKKKRAELRLMFGGKCAYCGIDLLDKGWHADHVEPLYRASKYVRDKKTGYGKMVYAGYSYNQHNERDDNYFPACAPCNLDKSVTDLETWRAWLQDRMIESMRHRIPNFRHAERFGRITINSEPLVFWFEKWREKASGKWTKSEGGTWTNASPAQPPVVPESN